ncbi:MAG: hypothetical protein R2867_38415 [Caldilineaceae bacterium]
MIVNRRVFHTRTGKMQETIAHLQAGLKDLPYPYRIYGSFTGRFNTVVMELEFEDLAQMQEAETARDANPATLD